MFCNICNFMCFSIYLSKFSPMLKSIIFAIIALSVFFPISQVGAAQTLWDNINVRDVDIGGSDGGENSLLSRFSSTDAGSFFYSPALATGRDGIIEVFTIVAFQIKNTVIILAAIFLAIAILRLLFSAGSEESAKKWRGSIIWVSVGIFLMQIVFSVRQALLERDINTGLGWNIGIRIIAPIIQLLQWLAAFGFLLMMIYAFYTIVGSAGDEESMKKWRRTILYGFIGFFLIRLPEPLIKAIYWGYECDEWLLWILECSPVNPDTSEVITIFARIVTYFNWFLMLVCVLLVIYAGWLVFISAGDEEKIKKAKSTVLYILIGLVLLIASHTLFRFFILQAS